MNRSNGQAGGGGKMPLPPPERNQSLAQHQAPKLFFKTCHLCDWKSNEDRNPRSLPYFCEELTLHMAFQHKISIDTAGQVDGVDQAQVQEQREYELATEDKVFPEEIDNAVSKFHRARYVGGPLNFQNCEKNMPMELKPVYTGRNLMHVNVPTQDVQLIKWMHNRASRKINKLERFSQENLSRIDFKKKLQVEPDGMLAEEHVIPCNEKHQLLQAACNYVELKRELHQNEVGARALFRVLLEKFVEISCTPELIKDFFANIVDENAGRAVRSENSLTYQECYARYATLSQTLVHQKGAEQARKAQEKKEARTCQRCQQELRAASSGNFVTMDTLARVMGKAFSGKRQAQTSFQLSSDKGAGGGPLLPRRERSLHTVVSSMRLVAVPTLR